MCPENQLNKRKGKVVETYAYIRTANLRFKKTFQLQIIDKKLIIKGNWILINNSIAILADELLEVKKQTWS